MVSQQEVDAEWASLADNDDEEVREAAMAARYTELAGLDEEERRARLKSMARGEYSLPDEKLRWNHGVGFALLLAAVFFVYHKW